jgi:hypothetical protein
MDITASKLTSRSFLRILLGIIVVYLSNSPAIESVAAKNTCNQMISPVTQQSL